MLRLNGKRVVLRTAISWGFWPVNGLFPSPQLAGKQILAAKAYGLNMLNFHRCIGNPLVLRKADELGLLYFEEPGGYVSAAKDPFAQALCREKLLRMVKRDRACDLIIYNMINEQWDKFGAGTDESLFSIHQRDLRDAHALDPSRTILYTSAWAGRSADPKKDKAKMNMRPFDNTLHMSGWWDYHRAGGPETWKQDFYKNPSDHYGLTTNKTEIVYWGEEGAVSAPPRLALIKNDVDASPVRGWDGQVYLNWYKAFDDFLTAKNLRGAFPTVDALCTAMGVVSIEHQGRKIEDTRICDLNDGYAINGWESELIDNHSGVVDCYRNPKADPGILGYYNQPVYVAVKPRRQIVAFPGSVLVDFYVVNEGVLKGPHRLQIRATAADGHETFSKIVPVDVTGGDVFAQMAAEGISIPIDYSDGMTSVTAQLEDAQGTVKASGHDQVLGVDWKKVSIRGKGAVYETGSTIHDFLKKEKGIDLPAFDDSQQKLDWLVVAKSALPEPAPVPAGALLGPDGKSAGLKATFFAGQDFSKPIYQRVDNTLDFNASAGSSPDSHVPLIENYSVRWEGELVPPADGEYTIAVQYENGVNLFIGGSQVADKGGQPGRPRIRQLNLKLEAGRPISLRVELLQKSGSAMMQLLWKTPVPDKTGPEQVLERARRDGTTIVILDRADTWLGTAWKSHWHSARQRICHRFGLAGGTILRKRAPAVRGPPRQPGAQLALPGCGWRQTPRAQS